MSDRTRRLAAVWFADIVGYTDLSSRDEEAALAVVDELQLLAREEVESRWASQNPSIVGPGRPEYLQGGEYNVRLAVELQDGTVRAGREVLCQLQFTAATGWIPEDVSLDRN